MIDMRRLMADAVGGARDMLESVAGDLSRENTLTDDEQLRQYEQVRGDPLAIVNFTAQRLGNPDAAVRPDVLAEAERYEDAMEILWDKKVSAQPRQPATAVRPQEIALRPGGGPPPEASQAPQREEYYPHLPIPGMPPTPGRVMPSWEGMSPEMEETYGRVIEAERIQRETQRLDRLFAAPPGPNPYSYSIPSYEPFYGDPWLYDRPLGPTSPAWQIPPWRPWKPDPWRIQEG